MRSSQTVAFYHLLAFVPCVHLPTAPAPCGDQHFAACWDDDTATTALSAEYFVDGKTSYQDLLSQYESSDAYEMPELCEGNLRRLCASRWVRSVLRVFADREE